MVRASYSYIKLLLDFCGKVAKHKVIKMAVCVSVRRTP